nr:Chain E, Acetolactate synthase isozyme 1 small subunit [Escherichia coli K-12]6LPI_F Chain F, Acetolactate synthase isozyme 1 small subunit [Escherichia coli K-12]6LPI_G Chain G, Acetolactate synthase isozyme 1 small subunit [Escherichia coli K-12]6LPI_H Chain H, Acetolactate synthase isozyme 1 small subunit [Escherichia coli K-12]
PMQNTTHDNVILELTVRNHPGVMTHVCGLFARRAFNVEGILCLPIQDSDKSHIWLLVNDDQRLEQMISQIDKLEDVVKVQRNQSDPTMFNKIAVFFQASTAATSAAATSAAATSAAATSAAATSAAS